MKRLSASLLIVAPLALSPLALAQGPSGPYGSGSRSAQEQARSTSPDALAGNSAAVRENEAAAERQAGKKSPADKDAQSSQSQGKATDAGAKPRAAESDKADAAGPDDGGKTQKH